MLLHDVFYTRMVSNPGFFNDNVIILGVVYVKHNFISRFAKRQNIWIQLTASV